MDFTTTQHVLTAVLEIFVFGSVLGFSIALGDDLYHRAKAAAIAPEVIEPELIEEPIEVEPVESAPAVEPIVENPWDLELDEAIASKSEQMGVVIQFPIRPLALPAGPDLKKLKKPQLIELAKQRGIKNAYRMKKNELVKAIAA